MVEGRERERDMNGLNEGKREDGKKTWKEKMK